MKYKWFFLFALGFEQWHIDWLQGEESLYLNGYSVAAMDNIHTLLTLGYDRHTILGLWKEYPASFQLEEELFECRMKDLISHFGLKSLEDYFWKHHALPILDYMGTEITEWKEEMKKMRELFRMDRKEKMQRLVTIVFESTEVEELEENCTEFQLEVLAEYYLEQSYLRVLKIMLQAGFHSILLQLFVDYPERFTLDIPIEVFKKRICQSGDVWKRYQKDGEVFLDALFVMEDEIWEEYYVSSNR